MEDLKILVDLCIEKNLSFSWYQYLKKFWFSNDSFEMKVDLTEKKCVEHAIKFLEEL